MVSITKLFEKAKMKPSGNMSYDAFIDTVFVKYYRVNSNGQLVLSLSNGNSYRIKSKKPLNSAKLKDIDFIQKDMAKTGLHCPKCGLWLPKSELKKGIKCPECGTFCKK